MTRPQRTTASLAAPIAIALAGSLLAACGEGGSGQATSPPPAAGAAATANTSPAANAAGSPRIVETASAGPIVAQPASVDYGIVAPRTLIETEITLTNTLDRPVRIMAAQPTCTCTTVDVTGEVIPARGTLKMPMGMQTSAAVGLKSAAVTLLFEGIDTPLRVQISAEVAYSVRAVPVPFIDALAPERLRGTFELESVDGEPFEVIAVQGQAPAFEGFDPATDPKRNRYRLAYDFTGLDCPEFPKYLLVQTDREDCPLVDLRVRHQCTRIQPGLSLAEFRAMTGRIPPGESGEFTIEIKNMGRARVDQVFTISPDATVELVGQEADGSSVLCTVRVTPRPGYGGLLQLPATFVAAGNTAELLVFGLVE